MFIGRVNRIDVVSSMLELEEKKVNVPVWTGIMPGDVIATCIVSKIGYAMLVSCICAFSSSFSFSSFFYQKNRSHVSLRLKMNK